MTRRGVFLIVAVVVFLAGCWAPPPPASYDAGPDWHGTIATIVRHTDGRLVCTRAHESSVGKPAAFDPVYGAQYDQGYQAPHGGGYQFVQRTWDRQAAAIGRPDLVGRPPESIWVVDQDLVAWSIYASGGNAWGPDHCA